MDMVCHEFFVATNGFLRGMVLNDILADLGVAVTLDVVVASERADPIRSSVVCVPMGLRIHGAWHAAQLRFTSEGISPPCVQ